jgi:hypothetical protein
VVISERYVTPSEVRRAMRRYLASPKALPAARVDMSVELSISEFVNSRRAPPSALDLTALESGNCHWATTVARSADHRRCPVELMTPQESR